MVFVHCLCALVPALLWFFSGYLLDKIKPAFFIMLLYGVRGALLAASVCLFISALAAGYLSVLSDYADSTQLFAMLSICACFIGIPVGFLINLGIAKNKVMAKSKEE